MSKTLDSFLGYGVGDMITLSDIQTQHEYDDLSVDFRIQEVRRYHEPNNFFTYTAYICKYTGKDDEQQIMVLIRQMGSDFDLFVFYLDQDGDITNFSELITKQEIVSESEEVEKPFDEDGFVEGGIEGGEETKEESEINEATEDLIDRFEVTLHFDDADKDGVKEYDVTWDKKAAGSTFGVEFHSTETGNDNKTIAEYFTNDETRGNPHCFIEWTGDSENGWIEIWYGCEIRTDDVEIFRAKRI